MPELSFPLPKNKGLVLNMEGFVGDFVFDNCTVQTNLIHIPGLAYTPQPLNNQRIKASVI